METYKLTYGLFLYRGIYFWRNIKDVPILIGRFFFMLKHGYNPIARWDYFAWFIDTTKDIFQEYLKDHIGYKIIDDSKGPEWNEQAWENIIKEMINCLDRMKEENYTGRPERADINATKEEVKKRDKEIFEWIDNTHKEMYKAKRRFFMLMNKYFYDLWD